jgi:hypothetical protein
MTALADGGGAVSGAVWGAVAAGCAWRKSARISRGRISRTEPVIGSGSPIMHDTLIPPVCRCFCPPAVAATQTLCPHVGPGPPAFAGGEHDHRKSGPGRVGRGAAGASWVESAVRLARTSTRVAASMPQGLTPPSASASCRTLVDGADQQRAPVPVDRVLRRVGRDVDLLVEQCCAGELPGLLEAALALLRRVDPQDAHPAAVAEVEGSPSTTFVTVSSGSAARASARAGSAAVSAAEAVAGVSSSLVRSTSSRPLFAPMTRATASTAGTIHLRTHSPICRTAPPLHSADR